MNSNIETIIKVARNLQEAERKEYLDEACGGDVKLRSQIEAMLAETMNTEPVPTSVEHDPDATVEQSETVVQAHRAMYTQSRPLPDSIGHYKIISEIGEGGMGTVYEAEQDSPRRRVALKVIKAGVLSKNLLLRFEIEAQILGKLDHPGIATIFEAGTFDEGHGKQPFFAMEFVQGELLTDFADKHKLGTRDRLGLLAKIADAVQHAHQKGVIHRDLKPGNILVTNEGQIKILDFGVARATDTDIQTATMQTDIGQLVGTIPYMSPEQASGNPDDLDTRSDVYALGIIGYELLTGRMPYDVKQKMIHEAVRVIQEDEPTTLSSINKTFRGDVEIIISKALVKEKERRYQSASDLAGDIYRYLNNEPIEARPPSTWYHFCKFTKRNKVLVVGVAAVLVVSVAGALVSINFAMGEAEQKRIAQANAVVALTAEENTQRELIRANEVKKLITDMFSSVSPETAQGQDVTLLKSILDDTSERLTNGEIKDELVAAELHTVIGKVYWSLGLHPESDRHLPVAVEISTRMLGPEHPATMNSVMVLALLYADQARYKEAEQLYLQTFEIQNRLFGEEDQRTIHTNANLTNLYMSQGQHAEAVQRQTHSLKVARQSLGSEHPSTLTIMGNLASMYGSLGRFSDAETVYVELLDTPKQVFPENNPNRILFMANLAAVYLKQLRYSEAEELFLQTLEIQRQVMGDEHPWTTHTMGILAYLYQEQGRYAEAEPLYFQAFEIQKRVLGQSHPSTLSSRDSLAGIYQLQGRSEEAKLLYEVLLEISIASAEHLDASAKTLNSVAWTLLTIEIEVLRNPAKALAYAKRACALEEAAGTSGLWKYLDTLALAQHMTGDMAAAVETQRRTLSLMPKGADSSVLENLAKYESALVSDATKSIEDN